MKEDKVSKRRNHNKIRMQFHRQRKVKESDSSTQISESRTRQADKKVLINEMLNPNEHDVINIVNAERLQYCVSEIAAATENDCPDGKLIDRFSSDEESAHEYDSESDCDDNNVEAIKNVNDSKIATAIKEWIYECSNVSYSDIDCLLKKLNPHLPELPKSHKTLLKSMTKTSYKIEKFLPNDDSAEFVYFGIETQLKATIVPDLHQTDILELQFNIDGLPLYTSSPKQFWPILGRVDEKSIYYEAFIIACYCGIGKPKSVSRYLDEFIKELYKILKVGIDINKNIFM